MVSMMGKVMCVDVVDTRCGEDVSVCVSCRLSDCSSSDSSTVFLIIPSYHHIASKCWMMMVEQWRRHYQE